MVGSSTMGRSKELVSRLQEGFDVGHYKVKGAVAPLHGAGYGSNGGVMLHHAAYCVHLGMDSEVERSVLILPI